MSSATDFLKERVPIDTIAVEHALSEPIPGHLRRWWFALGGTPAYLFVVQAVTGILLTFYYVPEAGRAWQSVKTITEEVTLGWYFRSLHKWAANLMIVAVIVHAMRVFFTGAYRRPRELNWMMGSLILFTTLIFGFTGYSLIYEQLSYWGATVAANLTEQTPFVGPLLAKFIRGGETIDESTLTRFFVFHIGVLPTVMTLLLAFHILLVRLHGVAPLVFKEAARERQTFPFFPDHFLTEVLLGVALMVLLTVLALVFPAELGEQANPLITPAHIKPEWYFYFTFRWLKLVGLAAALLSMGFFAFVFVLWPFVDRLIRAWRPDSEASVWIGAVGFLAILGLTLWEALEHAP